MSSADCGTAVTLIISNESYGIVRVMGVLKSADDLMTNLNGLRVYKQAVW